MATFTPTTPAILGLSAAEAAARAAAIAATGSPSPVPFVAIDDPPDVYTHIGHDAQYGRGRRDRRTVRLLILHTTEGEGFLATMSYAARRAETVSSTAYAGANGELGYGVPEADRPFTTGRWNDESLALEIVGHAAWSDADWRARPRQLEAIVRALVDWARRFHIAPIWLDAADVAEGASRQSATPIAGVLAGITDHRTANDAAISLGGSPATYSHVDIGPALRAIVINELVPEVARRLAGDTPPPPPPPINWSPPMSSLFMLEPEVRLVDTRIGLGLTRQPVDSSFEIVVPGDHAPTAAVVHLTVTGAAGPGYVALWADTPGQTSKINYSPADPSPQANTTLVGVGRNAAGQAVIRGAMRANTAELIVDLVGVIA